MKEYFWILDESSESLHFVFMSYLGKYELNFQFMVD